MYGIAMAASIVILKEKIDKAINDDQADGDYRRIAPSGAAHDWYDKHENPRHVISLYARNFIVRKRLWGKVIVAGPEQTGRSLGLPVSEERSRGHAAIKKQGGLAQHVHPAFGIWWTHFASLPYG
jgi:hypothetical protein